jgi:hypothetical protein
LSRRVAQRREVGGRHSDPCMNAEGRAV